MEQGVELKRLLCFVIVLALVSPGMYTLIKTENVAGDLIQDEHGNLVINGTSVFEINRLTIDPYTGMAGKYGMKGNITVKDGGTLIIRDAELYFIQDVYHHYWLSVSDNGRIIMENGSITVSTQQILPYVLFNISITNAGDCYINDSKIAFPGYFNVTGTNLTLLNSTFTNIEPPAGILPDVADMCDDAPVFHVSNSRIVFVNSSIEKCYENAYANATYVLMPLYRAGDDNTSNTNTAPLNSTDGNYYYVNSTQLMHVYGFDTQGNTGNILNAWLSVTYQTDLDYTSSTVLQISFDGGATWQDTTIAPNNQTTSLTETYTIGQTTFGNISNLHVRYLNGNDTLNVRFDQIVIYAQVYIGVNERDQYDVIFDDTTFVSIDSYIDVDFLSSQNPENPKDNSNPNHNRIVLRNNARAYLVNLTVNEMQSGGAHEDTPFITDASSEIYLYRWLDVSVLDAVNLPVQNARVSIAYNGVSGPIQQRVEMLNNITNPTNPLGSVVLAYLNKGVSNYNLTDASGKCSVPLVSDNISAAFWPNSMPYGNYRVSVTYNTTTLVKNVSFPVFPAINATSNRVTLNFSLAAVIEHPDIAISFSTEPEKIILANSQLELKVNITNTGSANATHFRVVFFEGFPQAGGTVFSAVDVPSLNAGVSIEITQNWSKAIAGKYKIVIVADYYNEIYEQNENNNTLSCDVIVYREGADMLIDGTLAHPNRTLKDINPYIHSGFIIVKGNGNLTLDNTSLNISQTSDYQYQIIVTENGSLFLQNNATISMDRGIVLSVADNGSLITRKGNLYNLSLLTAGNSNIDMKNTVVQDCMVAWDGAMIHLENTTIVAKEQPGSVYFADDFEGDLSGWTNYTIPARNGSWEAGTPYYISPHSGNVSFGTELLNKDGNGRYENDTQYVLISPQISLLAAPTALLTFYHYYRIQDDTAYVEVSTDMENWHAIASYTGTVSTWTKETIDITQYTGNMIYLRFRLSTNAALNDIGWYIDDVSVVQRFDIHARDIFMKDTAINTNLSELSATDRCTLVNATLPEVPNAVMARDSAEARIYRYLVVNVNDTNSQPVSGVNVNAYGYSNGTLCASGTTGGDGRTTLILLSDIINATTYQSSYFVGSYRINITLGSEVITRNISFMAYPYWKNVVMLNVTLSTPMPDLAVGITNPPAFVTTNSSVQITVRVNNTGNAMAANAEIALYDVYAGTQSLVGKQNITLAGGAGSDIQFTWQPVASGIHNLLVIADPQNNITESNESNNEYVCEVIVYRSGIDMLIINTTLTLRNTYYIASGFVYIDNGTLILENTTFKLTQTQDFAFGIYLYGTGRILMLNSTITSDYLYYVKMYDTSQIHAQQSKFEKSVLSGNGSVFNLSATTYNGAIENLVCNAITLNDVEFTTTSLVLHGTIFAENTTFDRALAFNGTDSVTLVAVTLPSTSDAVLGADSAVVRIYRYLDIVLTDINGAGIDGAHVYVYDLTGFPGTWTVEGITANGTARIVLLSDIINSSTPYYSHFVGVYIVHIAFAGADFWYNITLPNYYAWDKSVNITEQILLGIPDLAVAFTTSLPGLVPTGTVVYGNITVWNNGSARAENVLVEIYDGITTVYSGYITLLANDNIQIPFSYTVNVPGYHTLLAVADPAGTLIETTKDNNNATASFIAFNPGSLLQIENQTVTISNTTSYQYGSVLIGYNGTLILDNATLVLSQPTVYNYGIYLYSNGTLIMKNSTITSGYQYYMVSTDTSQINAANSIINLASITGTKNVSYTLVSTVFANASIDITASKFVMIGGSLTAGSWQYVSVTASEFYAQDIYYPSQLVFSGNARAILVNVTLSGSATDIQTNDEAQAYIYRYLDVLTLDGNKKPLETVNISMYFASNSTLAGWVITDIYGKARFVLLTDIINYTIQYIGGTSFFVGNYRLIANYSDELVYENISFESYPSMRNIVSVNITYLAQVPDFDVRTGDIRVPGTFDYIDGGNISITVRNIGPRNGVNIKVVVYDMNLDDNTETEIYTTVITLLSGEVKTFNYTWLPSIAGNHSIKVIIDPNNEFNETSKANNIAISQAVWFRPALEIIGISVSNTTLADDEMVYFNITIKNTGNVVMHNFNVIIEDRALPQTYQEFIAMLNINSTANITFSYLVVKPGTHDVNIRIELDRVYATQSLTLNVYAPPDLSVSAADIRVTFGGSDVYKVLEQTPLNITIKVSNIASTPAYNVSVEVYNGSVLINTTTIPEIAPLSSSEITLTWVASAPGMLTVSVLQCLQPYPEKYLDNNIAQKAVEVIEFPDLAVLDFYLEKEGNRTHNVTVGDCVYLSLNITNNATYTVDNITVEVFLGNISDENIVYASEISLNASEIVNLNFTWTVSAEGNITLNAVLNRNHTITEKNYTNNINTFNLTSLSARLVVILGSMASEFYIDDTPIVSGTVIREATGVGVPNINLTITIFKDDALYSQMNVTTDQNGNFSQALMKITEPGRYAIQISSTDISDIVPGTFTFNVPKPAAPQQFPWLMVIIAIIAVVGVSVGVVVLYFRRVAGKLVECGECGAYIPENATKCPKCGTEFEATTVKCSECGAWIDGKATVCPECGTVFTGKKVEAESYEEIMRKEFNAYVEKFRTEAKKELGKEYSESAFWAWWKNKPTYRTFSQWLKEEELKKKGALKCPQCTTLNEKTAKICHKCGSSLEGAELIQTEKGPGTKEVPVTPPPPKEEKAVEPKEVTQKAAEVKQPAPPQPTKTTVAPVQIPQQPAQPPAGQKPAPPQTPVPPKQVAPKEELPTLPGPLGVPPVQKPEEKAVLEFKPEEGAPGTPKVVVIKKPTAAKVVIPKKVVRKPMTPGTEQQAETPEEKKEQ